MEIGKQKAVVEGLLFVSGDEGVTLKQIADLLNIERKNVRKLLDELKHDYDQDNRGITMMNADNLYYLTTKAEHSDYYKRLLDSPQRAGLSQAALETLAIIVYRQPITRVEIEDIRGVNSDRSVRTLEAKSLIKNVGRRDTIGRPVLFGTTTEFLTYFGLTSLEELPSLPEEINEEGIEEEADLFFEHFNTLEKHED